MYHKTIKSNAASVLANGGRGRDELTRGAERPEGKKGEQMRKYELEARHSGQKSFYGKAKVTDYGNGFSVLTSYKTEVAAIRNGRPIRLWDGYSATTMKHVNEFFLQNGINSHGKREWDKMPVENLTTECIVAELEALRGIA